MKRDKKGIKIEKKAPHNEKRSMHTCVEASKQEKKTKTTLQGDWNCDEYE